MVIVRLKGGIGNQLFQFAFGRAIAEHRQDQLYFDLTYLTINPLNFIPRDFKLNKLTNVKIADQVLLEDFGTLFEIGNAAILSDDHSKRSVIKILNNPHIKAILLDGYYKDEFYQLEYAELIKTEIRTLLNQYFNTDIAKLLIYKDQESICVNLCHEDSLLPGTETDDQVTGFDYYREALEVMKCELINPHFYIFSDNSEQAEEIFAHLTGQKTNVSAIINHMPSVDNDLVELAIMSQCKHFILANCSYSWWGSYLADSPDKIVIAPIEFDGNWQFSPMNKYSIHEKWIRI